MTYIRPIVCDVMMMYSKERYMENLPKERGVLGKSGSMWKKGMGREERKWMVEKRWERLSRVKHMCVSW